MEVFTNCIWDCLGFSCAGLAWPGCIADPLGDHTQPLPLSLLFICKVQVLAWAIPKAPSAPNILRFCDLMPS